jgi:fatty-acyl-CoA synthase
MKIDFKLFDFDSHYYESRDVFTRYADRRLGSRGVHDPVGDRVMAAIEVADIDRFDLDDFDRFLAQQRDLSPKWVPSFARPTTSLPKLASMKIDKTRLRREAWLAPGTYFRSARGAPLRPLTPADVERLAHALR